MALLLVPIGLCFCLLMSAFAYVTVWIIPSMRKVILSVSDKRAKTRVISIAALCTGIVVACTVFAVG